MLTVFLRVIRQLRTAAVVVGLLVAAGACGAADDRSPGYADMITQPVESTHSPAPASARPCEAGAVRSCYIWLGKTGDLSNCLTGLELCDAGAWTECIDEDTLADDPELYAELTRPVAEP